MKELLGVARNHFLSVPDGMPTRAMTEVIVIVSEPEIRRDDDGQMVHDRTTETLRFVASSGGLRSLAKSFAEWAVQAEKIEKGDDADPVGPGRGPEGTGQGEVNP